MLDSGSNVSLGSGGGCHAETQFIYNSDQNKNDTHFLWDLNQRNVIKLRTS